MYGRYRTTLSDISVCESGRGDRCVCVCVCVCVCCCPVAHDGITKCFGLTDTLTPDTHATLLLLLLFLLYHHQEIKRNTRLS